MPLNQVVSGVPRNAYEKMVFRAPGGSAYVAIPQRVSVNNVLQDGFALVHESDKQGRQPVLYLEQPPMVQGMQAYAPVVTAPVQQPVYGLGPGTQGAQAYAPVAMVAPQQPAYGPALPYGNILQARPHRHRRGHGRQVVYSDPAQPQGWSSVYR